MDARRFAPLTLVALALAAGACSSESPTTAGPGDGAAPDVAPGSDASADGGGLSIAGMVKDQAGVPVGSAKIEVGAASVFSNPDGNYSIAVAGAGPVTLKVSRPWFMSLEEMVT